MAEFQRVGAALPTIQRPHSGNDARPSTPSLRPSLPPAALEWQAKLSPASPQAFAVMIERLVHFAQAFGATVNDMAGVMEFYRDSLADLPADLLGQAIKETMRTHKYNTLPRPADIRQHIAEELSHRHDMVRMLTPKPSILLLAGSRDD